MQKIKAGHGLLTALLLIVAPPLAGLGDSAPDFSGRIGPFATGAAFTEFIFDHQQRIVRLEVWLHPEDFDGSLGDAGEDLAFFVLWEVCEDLPEGEAPNSRYCTGTEINIDPGGVDPAQPGLLLDRGIYRLGGAFSVQGCDGPHQGLMGCTLQALPADGKP